MPSKKMTFRDSNQPSTMTQLTTDGMFNAPFIGTNNYEQAVYTSAATII